MNKNKIYVAISSWQKKNKMKEHLTNHTPNIYQDPRETFQLFKMPFTNNLIFTNNEI